MTLGERLKETLSVARLTPRHLGGATRVHFVTIYRLMRDSSDTSFPSIEHTLNVALDKINGLVAKKKLPLEGKLSRSEKTQRLKDMLDNYNH